MLDKTQKEKLRVNMLDFIDEIIATIKGKELRLSIPLESYFNEYGDLVLEIQNAYIGYKTNKTRTSAVYWRSDDQCIYNRLLDNKVDYHINIILDILKNKELIREVIKIELDKRTQLINEILG